MARLAWVVTEGAAHHVTRRANRLQQTFFQRCHYAAYRRLLVEECRAAGVEVRSRCLMPKRVHLILAPRAGGGLRTALAELYRRYSRWINLRESWRSYLGQGRFASAAMDDPMFH